MSRGPVIPTRCTTIELKDLADVEDFELNGEVGAFYGFEYTEEGLYKRAEVVTEERKILRLEQLRNVEVQHIENYEYKLIRIDNKWHLIPHIDWEIQFEFLSPYTYFDRLFQFRKAINNGPLHVSLVPASTSRKEIEIKPFKKNKYLLHRKDSITKASVTRLQFVPKFPISKNFTMIFDISIRAKPGSVSDVLLPGLNISWRNLDTETLRILIAIQKETDDIKAIASSDKIHLSVNSDSLTELSYINLTNLDLIGFYFIEKVLSEEILQQITNIK